MEETVVAKVLASLTNLCELGLFQKMRIWELMSATLGFLYHPNIWIREGMCATQAFADGWLTRQRVFTCVTRRGCGIHRLRCKTPASQ